MFIWYTFKQDKQSLYLVFLFLLPQIVTSLCRLVQVVILQDKQNIIRACPGCEHVMRETKLANQDL